MATGVCRSCGKTGSDVDTVLDTDRFVRMEGVVGERWECDDEELWIYGNGRRGRGRGRGAWATRSGGIRMGGVESIVSLTGTVYHAGALMAAGDMHHYSTTKHSRHDEHGGRRDSIDSFCWPQGARVLELLAEPARGTSKWRGKLNWSARGVGTPADTSLRTLHEFLWGCPHPLLFSSYI